MRNTSSPLKVIWVTQKGNPSKVGEVGDVSGRFHPRSLVTALSRKWRSGRGSDDFPVHFRHQILSFEVKSFLKQSGAARRIVGLFLPCSFLGIRLQAPQNKLPTWARFPKLGLTVLIFAGFWRIPRFRNLVVHSGTLDGSTTEWMYKSQVF